MSLLACVATVALVLFVIVQSYASRLAEDSQDQILQASATSILDAISIRQGGLLVDIPYSALSMLGTLSDDRVFYRIQRGNETITGYDDLPVSTGGNRSKEGFEFQTINYRGDAVRAVTGSRDLTLNSERVVVFVTVGQTRNGHEEVLRSIVQNTLLLCLGFVTIASLIGYLAVQVSLMPLREFADAISRRGPHDLRRVTARAPTEMAPLVTSLNDLIDRLRFSLARTEDFLTEAAHRVRTPLATVRAEAEVALHRVEKDENRQSLRNMIRAIDQTSRAAGQLIDHAMVSYRTDSVELKPVDVSNLCEEVISRLAPVAELRDIVVNVTTQADCLVQGDAILLQNAVQNLLDNAIKYSPSGSVIDVVIAMDGQHVIVSVSDDGIGFSDTEAERLKQRFARGDNAKHIAGSGLGLTIVAEVVNSHGGELSLGRRNAFRGAKVIIRLPHISLCEESG